MASYPLLQVASWPRDYLDEFLSTQRPAYLYSVEAYPPEPLHQEWNIQQPRPGTQHVYVAFCASQYHKKHPDQNSVKHRNGWHIDSFLSFTVV